MITLDLLPLLPSKQEVRNQIFYHGRANDLARLNEKILTTLTGEYQPVSYIRFVPGKQLKVSKYNDAMASLKAASYSLSVVLGYLEQHNDPLLDMYWSHFISFAKYGSDLDMDICKDILQFVKYQDNIELQKSMTQCKYSELKRLAPYKSIRMYPKDYILRFDSINEFDRMIPREEFEMYEMDYASRNLSLTPYQVGHVEFCPKLRKAIEYQTDWLIKSGQAEKYLAAHIKGSTSKLGTINDTKCACGSKRYDFWNKLTNGVTADLSPIINNHIDIVNRRYDLQIEYPIINPNGMQLWEYLPMLIIQEDPKKRRTAYKSNPIIDLIGYVLMDALKIMFEGMPNIACGHKRETDEDIITDLSRYCDIKRVRSYVKEHLGEEMVSTDLSECTENLNIVDYKDILRTRLVILSKKLNWPYTIKEINEAVEDNCNILYQTGITLSEDESHTVYYMRNGNMAGLPGSFHAMTDELSTIQLAAILEDPNIISKLKETEYLNIILENGDDGIIVKSSYPKYSELLEITTGPNVLNKDKTFSSDQTGAVEFCKTIYYDWDNHPITGYRYSSLYKLTVKPRSLVYLLNGQNESTRILFIEFLTMLDVPTEKPWTEDYNNFVCSYQLLTNVEAQQRAIEAKTMFDVLRLYQIKELNNLAERIALSNDLVAKLPKGMEDITPKDVMYIVTDGTAVTATDFRLLQELDSKTEDIMEFPYYEVVLDLNRFKVQQTQLEDLTGQSWWESHKYDEWIPDYHLVVIPVPPAIKESLELTFDNIIFLPKSNSSKLNDWILENYLNTISTKADIIPVKTVGHKMQISEELYQPMVQERSLAQAINFKEGATVQLDLKKLDIAMDLLDNGRISKRTMRNLKVSAKRWASTTVAAKIVEIPNN
jgi:hypothetical protein